MLDSAKIEANNPRYLVIFSLMEYGENNEPRIYDPAFCSCIVPIVVTASSRECAEAWGNEQARLKKDGGGILMQMDPWQLQSLENFQVHEVVLVDLLAAMAGMTINVADWPGD
jgi:hypothetical protein